MNRRTFFRNTVRLGLAATPIAMAGYGFAEANDVTIDRRTINLPNLPSSFNGLRVAFVSDIHVGPYLSPNFLVSIVRTVQTLNPDLILLGGDYILRDAKHIAPCFDVLKSLDAPMGVYGVLGNHDYWHDVAMTKSMMKRANIGELTNTGTWLRRKGERLRIAGVDDLWGGAPDIDNALGNTTKNDACLLLSHNPDVAETNKDERIGLMLSGHTHGGQIVIPEVGSPWIPSHYGMKYAKGLVDAPATRVYVSTGVGMSGIPMRLNCHPQIALLTLSDS